MQKYGETRINEMKNALNYLKTLHNEKEEDGRQLIEAGFVLSEGLLELVRMGKRYEHVMRNLTETGENILEENRWPHLMQATLTHLQNEFLKLDQSCDDGLALYINNAHELSRCDWYFQDEMKLDENERFNKLYVEYQKKIAKRAGLEKFEEALSKEDPDFARAGEELKRLGTLAGAKAEVSAQAQNTLNKAKERLGKAMFDLNENTRIKVVQLGTEMSIQDLTGLKFKFEKIGEAETNCQQYLTEKWKPRVQESSESTKNSLLRWINNFLGSIFNLIETRQFAEAEKKIDVANNMATMLHSLLKDDETLKKVKNLENDVTQKIETIEQKYLKLNEEFAKVGCTHNPYTSEPPKDVYESLLKESIKDKRIRYSQFWQTIWKDFEQKFHSKLESATSNPRQRKNALHLAKISLDSWPAKEKQILTYDLNKTDEELKKRNENLKQKWNDLLNGNDFDKLRQLYEEMEQQYESEIMHAINEELLTRLTSFSEMVEQKIDQASEVFDVLCKMNEIHEQFSVKVKQRQLIGVYEKSIDFVEAKVDKNANEIERKMKALNKDHLRLLCADLDHVSTLSRKNKQRKILTASFDARCNKLYGFFKSYFDDLDESYQNALAELDMTKLESILNTMQKYSYDNESYLRQIQKLEDVKIDNIRFFKAMVMELTGNFQKMQESVCNEGLMNAKLESSNEREQYFIELKKKLVGLRRSGFISGYLGNGKDASKYVKRCVNELTQEGTRLQTQIINEINDDKLTKEETLSKIHKQLDTLRMAHVVQLEPSELRNHLSACLVAAKRAVSNCIKKITEHTIPLTQQKDVDVRDMKLEIPLSQLYCAANHLLHFKDDIEKDILSILSSFQKTKMTLINTLASLLEQENKWGRMLVAEHAVFRGAAIMKFSKLTQDKGIDDVLKHIHGTTSNNDELEIDTDDLRNTYKEFDERYKELVSTYLDMKKELKPADKLTSETKLFAEKIKHEHGVKWNTMVKQRAVELMAFIFALWTIQNSEYYFQAGGGSDNDSFLMQPRAAQVISIIRLLSIDETGKDKTMERNLVEIGTGEGKSLTLGVTSALLALLGYDVSCACYSEYLSRRDYSAFEELFNALGVAHDIHYGTFNQLCERIINDGGNVRELTEELILAPSKQDNESKSESEEKYKDSDKKEESENVRSKILIIDEVDVFFNKEFYGNVYVPGATLRHVTIKRLTDWIWRQQHELSTQRVLYESGKTLWETGKSFMTGLFFGTSNSDPIANHGNGQGQDSVGKNEPSNGKNSKKKKENKKNDGTQGSNKKKGGKKNDNDGKKNDKKKNKKMEKNETESKRDEFSVTVGMIKNSNEYLSCSAVFGNWRPLLDEAIKDMVADLKTFSSTDYTVVDGKIGYKDGDSVSTSQVYGYRTLWTYYYEYDAGKVTRKTLEDIVGIYLKCGTFSYAEIPSKFDSILGVTGTLQTLLEPERQIMKETYGINQYTYMPSLFGETKFSFDETEHIKLADTLEFHEILKEEIRKRVKQFGDGRERCVFVFFENEKKLLDFYNYDGFSNLFKPRTVILTESLSKDEKITNVRKAPTSNRVLLSTKVFGRGTDFQVRDSIVEHNGGPHVIQTFVSDQVSEEKQIKGRTARQGGEGSYSMVLLKSDLEKYDISEDDIKSAIENKNLYDIINEKRHDFFAQEYKENSDFVKQVSEAHKDSEIFLKALKERDTRIAINKLKSYNMGAGSGKVKVAVLVDATASMGKLLQKAKNTVGIMYSRISGILEDKKVDSKCFQLQFIAYRNYNAPSDELLRYSGWCNNSGSLRHFLDNIEASYGWGNEAAEAALSYVEHMIKKNGNEIDEVIIIGDAGFNTSEQIVKKMKQKGRTYWARAGFDNMNTAFDYLPFFKQSDIAINCFYLHPRAKEDFEAIAKETNGESCLLDVNDEKNSSEILTRLISESVLNAAGGDAFVKAYREKYGDAGVQVATK